MLLDPAKALADFMQLTYLSIRFKIFLIVLAAAGFACAWVMERRISLWVARNIGKARDSLWPYRRKQRKQHKVIYERTRV